MRYFIRKYIVLFLLISVPINLKAKLFQLDGDTHKIIASGNVEIKYQDTIINGDRGEYAQDFRVFKVLNNVCLSKKDTRLFCKKLTVFLKKQVIEAEQEIKLSYLDYQGVAGKIYFDVAKQKMTLLETPVLKQGENKLVAKELILDFKNNKILSIGKTEIKTIK
jgi:lipopolysaccharide export system protein LptA